MEIWKDIEGYEGYQVSSEGRVRTVSKITHTERHGDRHWKDRILKQKKCRQNCMRIALWKDGVAHYWLVHRLVALTFLGNPPSDDYTVNHKDGNRLNNHIENLEWLTLGDNIRHGFENGLYSCGKKCVLIDEFGNSFEFQSYQKANSFLDRGHTYIYSCVENNKPAKSKDGKVYKIIV